MTTSKQDGTMELDVNQIDLLDLPVKDSGETPAVAADEGRASGVSKGPPPLPPLGTAPTEAALKVPSLPPPPEAKPSVVSARNLVSGEATQASPVKGFLIGLGAAGIVCVALGFFVFRNLHKKQAAPLTPPAATASAKAQSFTMAPIEFTASGSAAPEETASHAATAASSPPPATTAAPTTHASAQSTAKPTGKPEPSAHSGGDAVLKVEN